MRIGRRSLLAAIVALASACAAPLTHRAYVREAPYADAPLSPQARIFLVAGGDDVANFIDEVADQRRFWLAQGVAADEIACYYAKPTRAAFRGDRAQYRRLFTELGGCYPASTALLRRHLAEASAHAPPFVYLYVTSHGLDGLIDEDAALPPDERALLDRYVIQLGAGPGSGYRARAILAAYRGGADPDDLLWTPDLMAALLGAFPPQTPKIVVLQGCHSGGFIVEPRDRAAEVRALSNLTIIASARFDRTSFGCDAGPEQTYFGGLFGALLRRLGEGKAPPEIAWRELFRELRRGVGELERREGATPSLPVFFSSAPEPEPEPDEAATAAGDG